MIYIFPLLLFYSQVFIIEVLYVCISYNWMKLTEIKFKTAFIIQSYEGENADYYSDSSDDSDYLLFKDVNCKKKLGNKEIRK